MRRRRVRVGRRESGGGEKEEGAHFLTPLLSPPKLQPATSSKEFLDGIVETLYEHILKPHPLEEVRHGRAVTKRVNRPTRARLDTWKMRERKRRRRRRRRR